VKVELDVRVDLDTSLEEELKEFGIGKDYKIIRKSLDARKKPYFLYRVLVDLPEETARRFIEEGRAREHVPVPEVTIPTVSVKKKVLVVGTGPAGLFSALVLARSGLNVTVVERGKPIEERVKDVNLFWKKRRLNENSNVQFGEGGAGTFSDGKLFTRSNKRGDIGRILSILHYHGAEEAILSDAHPHIGTDRLSGIINRIRETVTSFGGEVMFNMRCSELYKDDQQTVRGVYTSDGRVVKGDAVILAAGHSARDVYDLLAKHGASLEAKTFAMGVRVEHPRSMIDTIQYHGRDPGDLGAASYRLAAQVDGRGVYSFCMCPGGVIVPSATSDDEIVVNGMSPSNRGTRWSNAAIIVEIRPEDIPKEFTDEVNPGFPDAAWRALAGIRYQRWLEHEAKRHGRGQAAPAQRLDDFVKGRRSADLPVCSYAPGVVSSRLDRWLPAYISSRLQRGFEAFDRKMRGFVCGDAVILGVESRTSSPVRVVRDPLSMECIGLPGLYPAGEGSGYAGGIVSSAMDGEHVAAAVAQQLVSP